MHITVESALYLFTWKIAPALAAGNCVIAKPSGSSTGNVLTVLSHICKSRDLRGWCIVLSFMVQDANNRRQRDC